MDFAAVVLRPEGGQEKYVRMVLELFFPSVFALIMLCPNQDLTMTNRNFFVVAVVERFRTSTNAVVKIPSPHQISRRALC